MICIKCFEESHESDLEDEINDFLSKLNDDQLMDLKYSTSHFYDGENQIYSFSACVIYRINVQKKGKISSGR
ncbi:MAG: sporulation protein Cse60 [Erysipelotrichaceae bacterium]|nr:sporulation protein Cse60 [Erysipelotrichaceae bacterium]MBQ7889175.1 sporulation protein Cse60 [Erysipelotrichaceae bacterium]